MGKDPLKVAKTYLNWFNNNWISFESSKGVNHDLPIVLSVDDSPIIQTMIRRSREGSCEVILTDRASEALKILSTNVETVGK